MIRAAWTVFRGELRLQLRQTASVLLLLFLPIGLAVATVAGAEAMLQMGATKELSAATGIGSQPSPFDDADKAVLVHVPDEWKGRFADDPSFVLVDKDGAHAALFYDRKGAPRIRHTPDYAGAEAYRRLRESVQVHLDHEWAERLRDAGLSGPVDELLSVDVRDQATDRDRAGATTGTLLPWILMFALLIAGLLTALDVFTGEKERRTIETLLTTRVDRRAVAAAKLGVVTAATFAAGSAFLVTLAVAQRVLGSESVGGPMGPTVVLVMIGIAALLSPQVAGVTSILGIYAEDYKTASMLSAPVMLLLLAPASVTFLPIELDLLLAAIPIANASLAARELLAGELGLGTAALVVGFSALHATGAVWIVARLLDQETALIGSGGVSSSGERRRGGQALSLAALAFCCAWFFATPAQHLDLLAGMVFTQIVLFAGIAVGAVAWLGLPFRDTLSLRAPTARDQGLAVLAGLAAPGFGGLVFALQSLVAPAPVALIEAMSGLDSPELGFWWPLLIFALLPSVCEELLFRGAILGLQRPGASPVLAVTVNAVLFGLLHIAFHRWLPTGALGLLVAVAVWRSRSLLPAITIHFANNALLLTLSRFGPELSEEPTGAVWAGAAVASAVAWVAVFGMRGPKGED